jgi:predicted N-acetyltransferase YhbS
VSTLRPATPADVRAAHLIDVAAFGPYGTAESYEIIAARQAVFPDGFLVVAVDGAVVAYGSSEKWRSERLPALEEPPALTHATDGKLFCITAMAVHPSHQNQGVGSQLLQTLLEVAQRHNCSVVILETTHAQSFYLRRGFQIAGARTERGVRLAVMRLELVDRSVSR